jgi:hypothetical protein
MQDELFQSEEFGFPAQATATLIFICPYGTPIEKVRFAIRRLLRAGYHVVAYQTTAAVFTDADPLILPELISRVREDIRARIAKLTAAGRASMARLRAPGRLPVRIRELAPGHHRPAGEHPGLPRPAAQGGRQGQRA